MDWDKLKERVVTTAIMATLAAAIPTYIKVEAQTRQLDLLQAELKEQKAEVRKLYENIGDLVTELMLVNPKAYNEPRPAPTPASIDQGIFLRDQGDLSVAAAAPPEHPLKALVQEVP